MYHGWGLSPPRHWVTLAWKVILLNARPLLLIFMM